MSITPQDGCVLLWAATTKELEPIIELVHDAGVRTHLIRDVLSLSNPVEPGMAIVALGDSSDAIDDGLNAIDSLKSYGLKVVAFAPRLLRWPIEVRCRVLLAGATLLFDSLSPTFGTEISEAATKIVTAECQAHGEEAQLRQQMKSIGIVGQSVQMIGVFRWLVRVSALSDFPVLITGETGTGKELLANALHQLDPKRRKGPFVVTNCSAISAGLAESELFGHRRGAFTGADSDRKGLFRSAEGGILFLDEIGELSESLQAKLLRVLQERRVLGVGSDQEVAVDVRVLAATNRSLDEMVKSGHFREDLYHRLNGLSLNVPPLRERTDDLLPLIEHFVDKYSSLARNSKPRVNRDFIDGLTRIDLPGNARQLENIVRAAIVGKHDESPLRLSDLAPSLWKEISKKEIPVAFAQTNPTDLQTCFRDILDRHSWNLPKALQFCEKVLLECVLQSVRGNQSQAARLSGITPRSVYNKVQKHKLHP
jgi:transcriptional regulator with GAF, ATPase, and Fis domain